MKKLIAIAILTLMIPLLGIEVNATDPTEGSITYNVAANYDYNSTEISISGGDAQLREHFLRNNSGLPVLDKSVPSDNKWDNGSVTGPTVLRDGSTYRMWYSGRNDLTSANYSIGYATSADKLSWSKQNSGDAVFAANATLFTKSGVSDPSVVKNDSIYHMWFTANNGTNYNIGYANSTDGIVWNETTNAVITTDDAFDSVNASAPSVISNTTHFLMWYTAYNGSSSIAYATSTNGYNWTKEVSEVYSGSGLNWDNDTIRGVSVVPKGTESGLLVFTSISEYIMVYSGKNDTGGNYSLGLANSTDGITWTYKEQITIRGDSSTQDVTSQSDPSAYWSNGTWMFYVGNNASSDLEASKNTTIMLSISTYFTTNPSITNTNAMSLSLTIAEFSTFAVTTTIPDGSNITYVISTDDATTWYYYSSGWVESNGVYANSSNSATISSNIGSLPILSTDLKIRVFLHTDNSSTTTPALDNIKITWIATGGLRQFPDGGGGDWGSPSLRWILVVGTILTFGMIIVFVGAWWKSISKRLGR